jgi:hypothetical protein
MGQVLPLKGNEFYTIRDLYDNLLELPKGWRLDIIEGVAFIRISSDKKKGWVKVAGRLAGLQFTLTIHDDSAILITEQPCTDIVAFVYDIAMILGEAIHKPMPDIPVPTEEEAQKWLERCTASSDSKYQFIVKSIVNMSNRPIYQKEGWYTNKYRMRIKFPHDNEPLLKAFAQMYGGEKQIAFYMRETIRDPLYFVVMDDILYYDSSRLEYFESVFNDVNRITLKLGLGNKHRHINVKFPTPKI